MSKYLITGITGFAGPHLAKLLLSEGHEVHGLTRATSGRETDLLDILTPEELKAITFQKADLIQFPRLAKIIEKNQYDGVFHLAAQSHPSESFLDPVMTFEDNVLGSVHLIEAITRHSPGTKFHYCSTSEVYGDTCKDIGVLHETDPVVPSNPYGVTKASIDLYMQERMKNGYIKGFITRAFSLSCDAYQIALMSKKLQKKVLSVGNLQTQRVVIDVRDTVNAYYLLMQKCTDTVGNTSNGRAFNVCGEKIHKMEYFTDMLIDISGIKGITKVINPEFYREIDIQVQIGDSSFLKELTGWEPEINIRTTLEDLYNYWLKKVI